MTFREKYLSVKGWKQQCLIVSLFHSKKLAEGKWSIEKTAHYFKISTAGVCQFLRLARCMDMFSEDSNLSRNAALKKIKGL